MFVAHRLVANAVRVCRDRGSAMALIDSAVVALWIGKEQQEGKYDTTWSKVVLLQSDCDCLEELKFAVVPRLAIPVIQSRPAEYYNQQQLAGWCPNGGFSRRSHTCAILVAVGWPCQCGDPGKTSLTFIVK
jgi:hypothetical protein